MHRHQQEALAHQITNLRFVAWARMAAVAFMLRESAEMRRVEWGLRTLVFMVRLLVNCIPTLPTEHPKLAVRSANGEGHPE